MTVIAAMFIDKHDGLTSLKLCLACRPAATSKCL